MQGNQIWNMQLVYARSDFPDSGNEGTVLFRSGIYKLYMPDLISLIQGMKELYYSPAQFWLHAGHNGHHR